MGSSISLLGVKVVIIGGGVAGTSLIAKLAGRVDLTLIEKNDRAFHIIGSVRALVEAVEPRLFAPYTRILAKGASRHVRGAATSVDPAAKVVKVRMPNGATRDVPYDVLIVATGTAGTLPFSPASTSSGDSQAALANLRAAIAAARCVAVVGGGPVGFEVCGELRTEFPDKAVHLVHAHEQLLSDPRNGHMLTAFRERAAARMVAMGVTLHLGVRATLPPAADLPAGAHWLGAQGVLVGSVPLTLTPSGGSGGGAAAAASTVLRPDVTIMAFTGKPNSEAFRSGPLAAALNADGRFVVNERFQVAGFPAVLAVGDMCGSDDSKTAYVASMEQAPKAAAVVLALARALAVQGPGADLAAAAATAPPHLPTHGPGTMALSAGRRGGIGQMGTWSLGDFMLRLFKSGDMAVGKFNAGMGYGGKAAAQGYAGAPAPEFSSGAQQHPVSAPSGKAATGTPPAAAVVV